jgi:hypothetical protein
MSLVFPFVGRPALMMAFGFGRIVRLPRARRELPGFILNALRP